MKNDMICNVQSKGCVEYLQAVDYYRLFFLLDGKVFIKGSFGKHLLQKRQVVLIPPGCLVSCSTFSVSNYVVMNCCRLQSRSNISFMEEIKGLTLLEPPSYTSLPVHEKLGKVLKSFFAYSTDDSHFPAVYDAVLILMRSLYTTLELAGLFSPMFCGREQRLQMEATI